jgi:hypothetical protein
VRGGELAMFLSRTQRSVLQQPAEPRIIKLYKALRAFPSNRKSQTVITTFLTIAAMLVLVLFPVLVPATISVAHAVTRRQRDFGASPAATYPLRVASARIPLPAAA